MTFFIRILLMLLLIFIVEYYFYKRLSHITGFFLPSINIKKLRKIYLYTLIFLNIYPLVLLVGFIYSSLTGIGRITLPETWLFDFLIMYPFWIFLLIQSQAILLFLPIEIVTLPINFINKLKLKAKIIKYYVFSLILIFSIIYVPIRTYYDFNSVELREIKYYKKDLNPDLENFKIVHIADIQADRFTGPERLKKYIDVVNEQSPDLVLISGDIITSTPKYINLAAEYLGKIKSTHGVFTCVGDHDHWAYREDMPKSIREITIALAKNSVWLIDNNKFRFTIDEAKLGVAFITNTYIDRINVEELDSLTSLNIKNDFNILLVHQPSKVLAEMSSKKGYDLFLAGHTHGGQITFIFPFFNLSPTHFETLYAQGSFYFDDMLMHVNRGLGMSLVPLRLNSTPEVTLITLKNK